MSAIKKPLHPGIIIKELLCDSASLSVSEASERLKVDRTTLSRLLNGHSGISPEMAYRLAMLLNTSIELWMNLQRDYSLYEVSKKKHPKIEPLKINDELDFMESARAA
jgi:addiction module HigA family antidote